MLFLTEDEDGIG